MEATIFTDDMLIKPEIINSIKAVASEILGVKHIKYLLIPEYSPFYFIIQFLVLS